jgi:transcriptional regulator with XRE-family HTH domain
MEKIGPLLKELRQQKDLSLRAAAKLIGISVEYLSVLEGGMHRMTKKASSPSAAVLKRISKGYGVGYYTLLAAAGYISEEDIPPAILEMLADPRNRDIVQLMQDPEDFEVLITNSRAILRHAEKVGRLNDKTDSPEE